MDQAGRVLELFFRLWRGERIRKGEIVETYHVTPRSVNRDFLAIRTMLAERRDERELLFDRADGSYYLSRMAARDISGMEFMALLKILLGSRALCREEMLGLVNAVRSFLRYEDRKALNDAIRDDLASYVAPLHQKSLVKMQWDLSRCIAERRKILLHYTKHDGKEIQRKVFPVQIAFSEFYFYLVAFRLDIDSEHPAFFRLDRIDSFEPLGRLRETTQETQFRFGDMRPAVPFMYGGKLEKILFRCEKPALEAMLDRIMDYQIEKEKDGCVWVKAAVFDEGFLRWAAMQGTAVEILRPKRLRNKMMERCKEILGMYEDNKKEDDDE